MKQKVEELLAEVKNYNATLIGVSKTVDIAKIVESTKYGIIHLGESKVQELQEKYDTFKSLKSVVHFIGHIQSNKLKRAVEMSDYIHTIDSIKKAKATDRHAFDLGKIQKVFIQVNISNDDDKFGMSKEDFLASFEEMNALVNIKIVGLMTIGLLTDDKEIIRNYYRKLKELKEFTATKFNCQDTLTELSMGMSDDYDIDLQEGATFVRVGSKIYGDRVY